MGAPAMDSTTMREMMRYRTSPRARSRANRACEPNDATLQSTCLSGPVDALRVMLVLPRRQQQTPTRRDAGRPQRWAATVKTCYLYSVTSRLINVRLDEERFRRAQALRERGMALSDVVREAIDERFMALRQSDAERDVKAVVRDVFERYPDPADLPLREYDVHDRHAARRATLRTLRKARP
jgi:hypothetical protein